MVFSDPIFLLAFLPLSFAIFHLLRIYVDGTASIYALVALSMVFYAYWSVPFLLLLLAQLAANYAIGSHLEVTRDRRTLTLAVIGNICLLGYFKYRNFFLENVGDVIGWHPVLTKLVVPLGLSFHTFQQIALLVDLKKGGAKLPPFLNYVLFVLFFPQLLAGPIVLHQEMGEQISAARESRGPGLKWVGAGLLIFALGLFKKVCLADPIGQFADLAFAPGQSLMMSEAWVGVIAYTLQLFFDFSGYSDMAVGLGLMFGFRLPNNFLVPYSASSMAEFWQQWHITIMRFFTTYLFNPLWLRARRQLREVIPRPGAALEFTVTMALPTLATFLLSGLWHGAGLTFLCFGLVHGVGMVVNQAWKMSSLPPTSYFVGWVATMLVVAIGMAYFRSEDIAQAHYILHQMFMASEPLSVPAWLASWLPLEPPIGTFTLFAEPRATLYCLGLTAVLAWLAVALPPLAARPLELELSRAKVVAIAAAGTVALIAAVIGTPRAFLYFAF